MYSLKRLYQLPSDAFRRTQFTRNAQLYSRSLNPIHSDLLDDGRTTGTLDSAHRSVSSKNEERNPSGSALSLLRKLPAVRAVLVEEARGWAVFPDLRIF